MLKLLLNLLIASCSLLLCAVAVEVAMRLIPAHKAAGPDWNDRPKFYYDPPLAIDHTGQDHSPIKPEKTFRIAVVGDSYSFGPFLQYDDTFAARLGRMLNLNSSDLRTEVINYGIPGYSTSHEIDLVKRALSEQADLVLLEASPFRDPGALREICLLYTSPSPRD